MFWHFFDDIRVKTIISYWHLLKQPDTVLVINESIIEDTHHLVNPQPYNTNNNKWYFIILNIYIFLLYDTYISQHL